jgi:hypothetical protein
MQIMKPVGRALGLALFAAVWLDAGAARAQATDFCGCAARADFGAFDTNDETTWQPLRDAGIAVTRDNSCTDNVTIDLPPDGVLVFDSLTVNNARGNACNANLNFRRNAANTPVTILVKGNVSVAGGDLISVSGGSATGGTTGSFGAGGAPGPGGFAGGDGAYQLVNGATTGGAGVGPGGGTGGTAPAVLANGGTFFGLPELRPLLGGSGGGGGRSTNPAAGCSAGGGGGGGGALLLAANGRIDIAGQLFADGGVAGNRGSDSCSSGGGGGSGGAIRLIAHTIAGTGSVFARGGNGGCCSAFGNNGGAGRIRLEAIVNSFRVDGTDPIATRSPVPGPLSNPITPTVRITAVDGIAPPADPTGFLGRVEDVVVPAPGVVQIDLATVDVPAGTDLEVTVKPKVGGDPTSQRVTLDGGDCTAGACEAATAFDLAAGTYIMEARATFETP